MSNDFANYFSKQLQSLPQKPCYFVSYHHEHDSDYYSDLSTLLSRYYNLAEDRSLDSAIASDNYQYLRQAIIENHIKGTSLTILLCGQETWKRRFIDWEIHATLRLKHGLLGIILPTAVRNDQGKIIVPDRFHTNLNSDYAHFINWTTNIVTLRGAIDMAILKSRYPSRIYNAAVMMKRSRS